MKWPTNKKDHGYMKKMQEKNKASSLKNPNELWMMKKLEKLPYKWTRQAQWGYRIFDFWCRDIGVAIEVDGKEHKKEYDRIRDEYNMKRSGILVIRVRNKNEKDSEYVINFLSSNVKSWNDRRRELGLKEIKL